MNILEYLTSKGIDRDLQIYLFTGHGLDKVIKNLEEEI